MAVRWTTARHGHYSQVVGSLRRSLGQYIRHNTDFKVGLTTNPDQRWNRGHRHHGWRELVVLYKTTSENSAREMERALIRHGKRPGVLADCWNNRPGGEGLRRGHHEYYVYVVLE